MGGVGVNSVDAVYIHRDARVDGAARWVVSRARWVWPDAVPLIQEAIDDKAAKYEGYLEHCDECWLLVVADSRKGSASMHVDELNHCFSSPFAQTFFLDFAF